MSSVASSRFVIVGILLFCAWASHKAEGKRSRCRGEECELKQEHFDLYSTIKRALDADFYMKGKDVIPLIRSTEVLSQRFAPATDKQRELNGTKLVSELLSNKKLLGALEVFASDEGRNLINLYKASINGNHQNLACSQWRVGEIEFAAKKLKSDPKLAEVFANIHRNFVDRSARKCLKSSCSSIDENMNHLNAILRHPSRRKGFVAREDFTGKLYEESSLSTNALDELAGPADDEPPSEFQREELELCHFFKRTNETKCQASGNELSKISFITPAKANNETVLSNFEAHLSDYKSATGTAEAGESLLRHCRALRPTLEYHLSGLMWYQSAELIAGDKLRSRTFWCPSLSYWLETRRLCDEIREKLAPTSDSVEPKSRAGETFAY